jgi:hypothetical protein
MKTKLRGSERFSKNGMGTVDGVATGSSPLRKHLINRIHKVKLTVYEYKERKLNINEEIL